MRKKVPSALPLILLIFGATVLVVTMLTFPAVVSAWQPHAYNSDQAVIGCCFSDCPQDAADTLAGYMIVAPVLGVVFGFFRMSLQHGPKPVPKPLGLT
jgi:hypothetical protein